MFDFEPCCGKIRGVSTPQAHSRYPINVGAVGLMKSQRSLGPSPCRSFPLPGPPHQVSWRVSVGVWERTPAFIGHLLCAPSPLPHRTLSYLLK